MTRSFGIFSAFLLALSMLSAVPASADPHKQNFQKRCPPNATSCK